MFLYLSMSRSLVILLALLALCIYCAHLRSHQENGQWKLGNQVVQTSLIGVQGIVITWCQVFVKILFGGKQSKDQHSKAGF